MVLKTTNIVQRKPYSITGENQKLIKKQKNPNKKNSTKAFHDKDITKNLNFVESVLNIA